jgi:hypothetical protein
MSRIAGLCAACGVFLVLALAGAAGPSTALAGPCPNAALRSGPAEALPDCRAYEQVSPPDTGGLDAVTLEPLQPAESSACEPSETCTIAYMTVGASFAGAQGNEFANAYLASRSEAGWQTTPISPPTPQAPPSSVPHITYAFSADLTQAIVRVPLQQLAEGAPEGVYNLYLRDPEGHYALVSPRMLAESPRGGCSTCFEEEDVPAFAGASADFRHVLFEERGAAAEAGVEDLYEAEGGEVHLVGVLPDGKIPPLGAKAGAGFSRASELNGDLDHAISADGSRVLFEADADGGESQEGDLELYDRLDDTSTVEVSAPAPGAEPEHCETPEHDCKAQEAQFWAASGDGDAVFFTSKAALTRESYVGGQGADPKEASLYRFDPETGELTNLLAAADGGAGSASASVLGVVGISESGSYVYFVAKGRLTASAKSEEPNLYVWHEGAIAYVATLREPEAEEEREIENDSAGNATIFRSDVADWTRVPTESQAYVTPDGRHLAFMSARSLTGYDNEDAQSTAEDHIFDHEVFEYSAETGQLVCASCDPSGARPLGSAFLGAELTERASTPFHQPRSLSDDGSRLFFTSPDPLVPGLSGGVDKVFEYEDGAPQLISGAEGGVRSVFLDASASGDDVFFATREELAPTGTGELLKVYDARVDGGFSAPASTVASCPGAACLSGAGPPPVFATPLSASFVGAGNHALAASSVAKPSPEQLLARVLARCRKLARRKRRAQCTASARRRYAPHARRVSRVAPERGQARR